MKCLNWDMEKGLVEKNEGEMENDRKKGCKLK